MCELLALSSSRAARLTFSLHALASHGSTANSSHDGWGVAFYQGKAVALFRAPEAAGESALVRYLESNGPSTNLAISHIRHATRGVVNLANTQPFTRELGGRTHVFAHNGDLPGIWSRAEMSIGSHRPIGQTDSEQAFCVLLARLYKLWNESRLPDLEERIDVIGMFAAQLRTIGPANFLYSDGDVLIVHADRRFQLISGRAEPPGLWMRARYCPPEGESFEQINGLSMSPNGQKVILFASVPLSAEEWTPLAEGQLIAVREGEVVASRGSTNHRSG